MNIGELYSEVIEGFSLLKAEKSLVCIEQAAKILFVKLNRRKIDFSVNEAMKPFPEDDKPKTDWKLS